MLWFSFLIRTIGYLTFPYPFPSPFCCLWCLFIALFGWFGFAWFLTLITSSRNGDREGVIGGWKTPSSLLLSPVWSDRLGEEHKSGRVGNGRHQSCQNPPLLIFLPGFLEMTHSSNPFVWAFQGEKVGPRGTSMKGWPERENSCWLDVTIWVCKGFTLGKFLFSQSKLAEVWP